MQNLPIDQSNCFISEISTIFEGRPTGVLQGLTFGIKDIFDIAGMPTSFGSPSWLKTHPIPTHTTPIVGELVDAGATLIGKTHTDELTYSILGMNAHYGTPINPLTPGRVPGGSSSGSAVAVAAKLVDFAIGSDTGGSVRAPASFCGIYGIRPTHGKVLLQHARPLAKSFDALGWFARDAKTLYKVGQVLLKEDCQAVPSFEICIPQQVLAILPEELRHIFQTQVKEIFAGMTLTEIDLPWMDLPNWMETFRVIQAREIWLEHGAWASEQMDSFGSGIKQRFLIAREISQEMEASAREKRQEIQTLLNQTLNHQRLFLMPTVSNLAPLLNSSQELLEQFRKDTFQLLCIAGLGGLPQVNIPAFKVQNSGFGISLMGPKDSDIRILKWIEQHLSF